MTELGLPPTRTRAKVDHSQGRLVGSRCRGCTATSWPPRARCERCGAETDTDFRMSDTGTLLSWTTVWVSRPGLSAPYQLGQAVIDGTVFFGHVRGVTPRHRVPLEITVKVGEPGSDILFWFEPRDGG